MYTNCHMLANHATAAGGEGIELSRLSDDNGRYADIAQHGNSLAIMGRLGVTWRRW